MRVRSGRALAKVISPESGFAMIMALVVVLILWLLTAALANLAVSEYATAAGVERSGQAFLAAEAGVERAIADLNLDSNWGDNLGADAGVTTAWTLRYQDLPLAFDARFTVWLRHDPTEDPSTNMQIRAIGEARGAARAIEYTVRSQSDIDLVFYSVNTLSTCDISGGGSVQFHGSAYVEQNMCLKGGAQAGFYNDRYVLSSDAPDYFNHLYINGTLDTTTGNPSIGEPALPFWWLHVAGSIIGPSNRIFTVNYDNNVPPPFYPNVLDDLVRPAFDTPTSCPPLATLPCRRGNTVEVLGSPPTMRLAVCRWNGTTWVLDTASSDLVLNSDIFYLPEATWAGSCATDTVANVRASGDYMLFWDGTVDPVSANSTNLVFPPQGISDLHVYIPGDVMLRRNVRYEGKGTVVVGNQPQAILASDLQPQSGCAFDFNSVAGDPLACDGNPNDGHSIVSRVSSCLGSPGTDNPSSTYVSSDLAVFIVNGSAFSDLNANACAQEINAVTIVGDRNATGDSICGAGVGACFRILKKLQWYGVLMNRQMGLGQVPDFWQMPDLRLNLPSSLQDLFRRGQRVLQIERWQEIF